MYFWPDKQCLGFNFYTIAKYPELYARVLVCLRAGKKNARIVKTLAGNGVKNEKKKTVSLRDVRHATSPSHAVVNHIKFN